jgi:hypothetical protein
MYHVLRTVCLFCHKFKVARTTVRMVICVYIYILRSLQLSIYAAKLRLIEHGLLVAAKGLDDVTQQKKTKGKAQDDNEEDGDELLESSEDFEKRVNAYVALNLSRASSSKRDNYKDGLVYQARKDLIQDFIRVSQLKKCQNCDTWVCLVVLVFD